MLEACVLVTSAYHVYFLTVLQAKLLDRPLYVSLIVNCVLLVVLLIVTIVWRARRANVAQETEQTICERCTNLFTDGAIPTGCKKNGTDTCCCQASLVINALVQKVRSKFCKAHYENTSM